MSDRVDLNRVGEKLAAKTHPVLHTIKAMHLELLAYRAAVQAGREQLDKIRNGDYDLCFLAGFEAYHQTITDVVDKTLNPPNGPFARWAGAEPQEPDDDRPISCPPDAESITDFGTGCRCPKLGKGTPEHAPGFGCQPGYEPGAALAPEVCGTCGEHPCTHHECLIKDGRCLIKGCTAADQHGTPDARPEPGN